MCPNSLPRRPIVSPLGALAISLAAGCLSLPLVVAPTAEAYPRTVTVNTGAGDLNVRSAPSANSEKIGSVGNQARVVIVCFVRGEAFSGGPYRLTTNIWNRLDKGGFVTDAMLNTGSNEPVVPPCSAETPAPVAPARATGQKAQKNPATPGSPEWGALAKWFQVSGQRFYPALSGPPKDWANAARAGGWTVVERPEPRSIVVFQPGADGAPPSGHVAWVDTTADRRDGVYIGITEVHGNGDGLNSWTSRQVKDLPGMTYILLP
ncbi:MAG TPA: CHAP domain-containing protein [Candidatus Tectomicrobia bacterium]|nr:CHAP domain-containing protein [Candidatus Tectomicrobia bacterium]